MKLSFFWHHSLFQHHLFKIKFATGFSDSSCCFAHHVPCSMCMSHLFKASYNFCLMKPFQSIWTADDSHNFKFPSTEFYHHVLAQLSLCLCDCFFSFFYPHSKRMCTSCVSLLLKISFWSYTRKVENARLWDLWTIINHFSRELHFLKKLGFSEVKKKTL